jgi:hypothetical protein
VSDSPPDGALAALWSAAGRCAETGISAPSGVVCINDLAVPLLSGQMPSSRCGSTRDGHHLGAAGVAIYGVHAP